MEASDGGECDDGAHTEMTEGSNVGARGHFVGCKLMVEAVT